MDKKTKGAWLIHHCNKLGSVRTPLGEYEQINFAGKCGMILNGLAASDEIVIDKKRLSVISKAAGISTRLELPTILSELERNNLIDQGASGVAVLGLTTEQTLQHTAGIYESFEPSAQEEASIIVSEMASERPIQAGKITEFVSDSFKITSSDASEIIGQFSDIGFVDSEQVGQDRLLFNGNLFRKDNMRKINGVLSSFSTADERKTIQLIAALDGSGCLSESQARSELGTELFEKLVSIGFVDISTIGNEQGTYSFITRPAAFKKFSNALVEDAFDLAKAFVTSLTYGITISATGRGKIRMIEALMRKLLNGYWIGPATAIGQDYKVLELKGVIEVRPAEGGMFNMRLLKKDVGAIAYKVISEGEAATSSMAQFPGVSATRYTGPEYNRMVVRKRQSQPLKKGIANLLDDLRTGGIR